MSLTLSLLTANSGLRAAQSGLDLIARNIANANTPGYTRKTQEQSAVLLAGEARGVLSGAVNRLVSDDLQRQFRMQAGLSSRLEIKDEFLLQLETLFGQPDKSNNVAAIYRGFEDSFLQLKTMPDSPSAQSAVLSTANDLTFNINRIGNELVEMRRQAEQNIAVHVKEVNMLVGKVRELNLQIVDQLQITGSAADLEDQRDMLLNELASLVDVSYFRDNRGQIFINTANGQALLDDTAYPLTFEPQAIGSSSKYTPPQTYPTSAPNLGGLQLNGTDIAPFLKNGRISGLFELRDQILPQAMAQLDEFAGALITAFEAQGLTLFTDPLNPPPHPHPGPETVGLSTRIQVNSDVTAEPWRLREGTSVPIQGTNQGDTALIDDIIANIFENNQTFRTTGLGPSGTPDLASGLPDSARLDVYISSFISFQANQRAEINTRRGFEDMIVTNLEQRMSSDSGVNIDEELAHLITIENAYSASARTLQTIQRMLDELMQII